PGTIGPVAPLATPPAPLGATAGALALALCDHDTPVWLTPALARSPLREWLAFHTGATVTDDRLAASFAFVELAAPTPAFSTFAAGSQDYPDRSTTLVVEVPALAGGDPLVLTGPGIDGRTAISPRGLPDAFLALWAENRRLFPRGIDLILVSGGEIVCLPRTTAIARKEG
ncbi:phosphonate C-P lyase system protein PhnH, partial [Rhizobium sp. TRM95111]|uniref:phosphonate C-P lyase system protein PhnH n=1 Tax=Rhizobium alarense TaxID=2846851 RepID=UPI001F0CCBE2